MIKRAMDDIDTLGQLLEQLGDIPPSRVLFKPLPGQATEADLLDQLERRKRICELVDGTLVEKPMGYEESSLTIWIGHLLMNYLSIHKLGKLSAESGAMRLMPNLVRIPDISFVRWEKYPDRTRKSQPIADVVPDLAIEILSASNTASEMERKVREYFLAGTEVVWLVNPLDRTITVYPSREEAFTLTEVDTLDGGTLLPGLDLPVRRIFEEDPPPAKKPRRKKT